jgi:hypothetical protein
MTSEETGAVVNTLYLKMGNVGIGTNNPLYKLEVNGSAKVSSLNINGAYSLPTAAGTTSEYLRGDGTWAAIAAGMSGTGTINYLSKFTGASTLGSSLLYDNGTNVGIGSTSPNHKLDVNGNLGLATSSYINFGSVDGSAGYGIRDNSGVIEFKSGSDDWTRSGSGSGCNHTFTTAETWSDASCLSGTASYQVTINATDMTRV